MLLVLLQFAMAPVSLGGQYSLSTPAAQELSTLLVQNNLDSIATKDPEESDRFIAALFFPHSQLLVVAARYAAPSLLDEKLAKRQYREIYTERCRKCSTSPPLPCYGIQPRWIPQTGATSSHSFLRRR